MVDRARAVRRLPVGVPRARDAGRARRPAAAAALAHRALRRRAGGRADRGRRRRRARRALEQRAQPADRAGGRPIALALAGAATWRDGEPEWADLQRARRAAAGGLPGVPASRAPALPGALRPALGRGRLPRPAGRRARHLAWMRLKEGGPLDHLAVTAMSDGWMPAAFSKLGGFAIVPTFDLTIHFRAPLPAPGSGAGRVPLARSPRAARGRRTASCGRRTARCVAQSRQLAMMRERRGERRARLPRARLEPRRPARAAAGRRRGPVGQACRRSRPPRSTKRAGRRGARPAGFLDACVRIETALRPEALLDACKAVEARARAGAGGVRHGPRPVDADVLLLGTEATVGAARDPAPRARAPALVLVPLLELDPGRAADVTSLATALAALKGRSAPGRPPLDVRRRRRRVAFVP